MDRTTDVKDNNTECLPARMPQKHPAVETSNGRIERRQMERRMCDPTSLSRDGMERELQRDPPLARWKRAFRGLESSKTDNTCPTIPYRTSHRKGDGFIRRPSLQDSSSQIFLSIES